MEYFLYRLLPPRPTFPQDLTKAEEMMMQEHFKYWGDLVAQRVAIVVGPVIDPKGTYGLAVVETKDEAAARNTGANDPAIKSGMGFRFEIYSMPKAFVRS